MSQRPLSNLRRFCYSFELYLRSEKLHHFALETAEALHSWTRSIGKVGPCPAAASALGLGDQGDRLVRPLRPPRRSAVTAC